MNLNRKTSFIILPLLLCLFSFLMASGCSSDSAGKSKRIGIIAASDFEVQAVKDSLKDVKTAKAAGTLYYSGKIGSHEVICVQCGMGKVSAALGAQAMITQFHPDVIINTGCAGALSEKLEVGDTVLADVTAEWDLDTIPIGNPRGYVTAMDCVKMFSDRKTTDEIAAVIGDSAHVFRGLIVSGDQFIAEESQRKLILDSFPDALCVEMEGAAVGHVCAQNGIPFCVIRCMSDNANGDSGVNYAEFSAEVSRRSAEYLLDFLRKY